MNLTELKQKTPPEILAIAKEKGVDGMSRARKQDVKDVVQVCVFDV